MITLLYMRIKIKVSECPSSVSECPSSVRCFFHEIEQGGIFQSQCDKSGTGIDSKCDIKQCSSRVTICFV